MKTFLKTNLKKILSIVLVGIIVCSLSSFLLTTIAHFRTQDSVFVVGLLITMFALFSLVGGRPLGYCMEGSSQADSKYISNDKTELVKMDKEKLLGSVFISDTVNSVKSTVISTEFLTIGLIALAISFLL